jgi:hypothetical protein
MTCDHNWTIKILDVNEGDSFEIRPVQMSLKMSQMKYDFCRAKFPIDVGREMKPHTRYNQGALSEMKAVEVCYNGNSIQRLMFRPDWVDYGTEFTHIQFHDLHKSFANDIIDIQRDSTELKTIYKDLVEKDSNGLIKDLIFQFPSNKATDIVSLGGLDAGLNEVVSNEDGAKILVSGSSIDFENISLEKAITTVNKKFKVRSWFDRYGNLIVGLPEDPTVRHVAAANDERVWRFKDPSISHGRTKIKKAIVWGSWKDADGVGGAGDAIDEFGSWFVGGKGAADYRTMGIAERNDIDSGEVVYVENKDADKDSLKEVARLALKEAIRDNNGGTIEIDPELSGTEVSKPTELSPGQSIQVVPNDNLFNNPSATSGVVGEYPDNPETNCGQYVNNEAYKVTEVEHNVTEDGEWQIHADLGMYPDISITSYVSHFEPSSNEWVNADKITEGVDVDISSGNTPVSFD